MVAKVFCQRRFVFLVWPVGMVTPVRQFAGDEIHQFKIMRGGLVDFFRELRRANVMEIFCQYGQKP